MNPTKTRRKLLEMTKTTRRSFNILSFYGSSSLTKWYLSTSQSLWALHSITQLHTLKFTTDTPDRHPGHSGEMADDSIPKTVRFAPITDNFKDASSEATNAPATSDAKIPSSAAETLAQTLDDDDDDDAAAAQLLMGYKGLRSQSQEDSQGHRNSGIESLQQSVVTDTRAVAQDMPQSKKEDPISEEEFSENLSRPPNVSAVLTSVLRTLPPNLTNPAGGDQIPKPSFSKPVNPTASGAVAQNLPVIQPLPVCTASLDPSVPSLQAGSLKVSSAPPVTPQDPRSTTLQAGSVKSNSTTLGLHTRHVDPRPKLGLAPVSPRRAAVTREPQDPGTPLGESRTPSAPGRFLESTSPLTPTPISPRSGEGSQADKTQGTTGERIQAINMPRIPRDYREGVVLTRRHLDAMRRRRDLVEGACNLLEQRVDKRETENRQLRHLDHIIKVQVAEAKRERKATREELKKASTNRKERKESEKAASSMPSWKKWLWWPTAKTQDHVTDVADAAGRERQATKANPAAQGGPIGQESTMSQKEKDLVAQKDSTASQNPALMVGAGGGPPDNPSDSSDSRDSSDDDGRNPNGKRPRGGLGRRNVKRLQIQRVPQEVADGSEYVLPPHPAEDYSDKAYEDVFYELYKKIWEYVHRYYMPYSMKYLIYPQTGSEFESARRFKIRLWSNLSPEFIHWLEMVVDGDPGHLMPRDWSSVFLDPAERRPMLCAIISKIIEIKVFGDLLFGGDEFQMQTLDNAEKSLYRNEGVPFTQRHCWPC